MKKFSQFRFHGRLSIGAGLAAAILASTLFAQAAPSRAIVTPESSGASGGDPFLLRDGDGGSLTTLSNHNSQRRDKNSDFCSKEKSFAMGIQNDYMPVIIRYLKKENYPQEDVPVIPISVNPRPGSKSEWDFTYVDASGKHVRTLKKAGPNSKVTISSNLNIDFEIELHGPTHSSDGITTGNRPTLLRSIISGETKGGASLGCKFHYLEKRDGDTKTKKPIQTGENVDPATP